jgi:hypothetical protein
MPQVEDLTFGFVLRVTNQDEFTNEIALDERKGTRHPDVATADDANAVPVQCGDGRLLLEQAGLVFMTWQREILYKRGFHAAITIPGYGFNSRIRKESIKAAGTREAACR